MSLYNMINGYSSACVFILPLLGRKAEEYPRFRDCFVTEDNKIAVFTRVGGGNRNCGFGEEKLYSDPNYVTTYDDEFDRTYGTYVFNCPEKLNEDFEKLLSGKLNETSDEYVELIESTYPILAEKGIIKKFCRCDDQKAEGAEE